MSKKNIFGWYVSRLKAMSVPEVGYRINKKIKQKKEEKKYSTNYYITSKCIFNKEDIHLFEKRLDEFLNVNLIDLDEYKVEEIINIFDKTIDITKNINWHRGYVSNWEKLKYSNSINFKYTDEIGDVRYTWEINRHLFFPKLALNYKKTRDEKYIQILKEHFYNWINENPFLKGVNWASPMEIAIRAYQWIITYSMIKDKIDDKFKVDLINSIIYSIRYVNQNYSLFSSANNHLIIEAVYCGIIGYLINPIYKNQMCEESIEILNREIKLQNFEDGVNKEQATHYQAFVVDGLLQFGFMLKKLNKKYSEEQILYRMCEFISVLNKSGSVIEFGDSDDAKLISFNLKFNEYYEYVLELASLYFGVEFIECHNLKDETKFVSGVMSIKNLNKIEDKEFYMYKDGGYAIFNINNNFMLFDIGELGFGSIAAHGHADALSIIYSCNKKKVFIDPGTYIYNVQAEWRNYFRKTSSHNTLSINDIDQSEIKGPFLWGRKANTKILEYGENKDYIFVKASNDGYGKSIHTRSITYLKKDDLFVVVDEFDREAQVNYTLDEKLSIDIIDKKSIKLKNIDEIFITFSEQLCTTEKWISKSFMNKTETIGIKINNDFSKNKKLFTIISKNRVKIEGEYIITSNRKLKYNNCKDIGEV